MGAGGSGVRFPGRSNRHSVANDSPPLGYLIGAVLARCYATGMGPATRYTLRRNTGFAGSRMKIYSKRAKSFIEYIGHTSFCKKLSTRVRFQLQYKWNLSLSEINFQWALWLTLQAKNEHIEM